MHFNPKRSFGSKFTANGVFISGVMHVNCGIMRLPESTVQVVAVHTEGAAVLMLDIRGC